MTDTRLLMPVEMVEKIILSCWESPMDVEDRIHLFTTLCLVNHTWLSIFIRIALRDVHILTPSFAQHYLALLRTRASWEYDHEYQLHSAGKLSNQLCRSLTFHIDGRSTAPSRSDAAEPAIKLFSDGDLSANAVSMTLYTLETMLTSVPNLRHVTLIYSDWGFDDIFDQCRLLPMPRQVAHLELRYLFSEDTQNVASGLRDKYIPGLAWGMRWGMEGVRTLTVVGAPGSFVGAVMAVCPNLETLRVADDIELRGLSLGKGLQVAKVPCVQSLHEARIEVGGR